MNYLTLGQVNNLAVNLEFLVDNMLPKGMLCSLVGSSEGGKTQLAFQLAAAVAAGADQFLDLKLRTAHKRVMIIPTEDPVQAIKARFVNLRKLYGDEINTRINFCMDVTENPIEEVKKALTAEPVDLLIIDTFQDFFSGDINRSTDVRPFLDAYKKLAEETGCTVLFIHHYNKAAHAGKASKKFILGSQSYEAKMRSIISLESNGKDKSRIMEIIKGNLVSESSKESTRRILTLDDTLVFRLSNSSAIVQAQVGTLRERVRKTIQENGLHGHTSRQLSSILTEKYHLSASKTLIAEILKEVSN